MAMSHVSGKHYSIQGRSITLFGVQGLPSGKNWAVGMDLFNSGSYMLVEIDPSPVLSDILDVIRQDESDGNFDKIKDVMVSSRIAVLLYLEGVLTRADFIEAKEGTIETKNFIKDGAEHPAIQIPSVQLGEYNFPLLILSEKNVGTSSFATLDKDNNVV